MSKSNTTICAAKNCYTSLITHPSKSFFGFPSDMFLCKVWLENTGRTDLDVKQVVKSRGYFRLCEDHFEDKWFTDSTKKILKRKLNPVPTVLVNNIKSLVPLEFGSESHNDGISVDCTLTPEDLLSLQLLDEGDDVLNGYVFDSNEFPVEKQQMPITYNSKPLLKPSEFITEAVSSSQNIETELCNFDTFCRFCMNEVSQNYVELFSNTADAMDIRKISKIVLQSKTSICDGLPHRVCQQCVIDLKTCGKLIEKFQNADRHLRSIAKYSLFNENDDITEMTKNVENSEDALNESSDSIIEPESNTGMVLPNSSVEGICLGSDEYLADIDVADSSKYKDHIDFSQCVSTAINSEQKNGHGGSGSIDTASQIPSRPNKHKQTSQSNFKFYKRRKSIPSEEAVNKTILMTQDILNIEPRQELTHHMPNYSIVNLQELSFMS